MPQDGADDDDNAPQDEADEHDVNRSDDTDPAAQVDTGAEAEMQQSSPVSHDDTESAGQSSSRRSHTIPQAEVRRIVHDASSILPSRMGSTRSKSAALAQHHDEETLHNAPEGEGNDSHEIHQSLLLCTAPDHGSSEDDDDDQALPSTFLSGSKKLTEHEMRSAFDTELAKWRERGAFTPVDASSVPKGSNIIGSHTVYKRKFDGTPKARIVPWGHRDKDKDFLRGDAPSVSFEIFRLVLSLASEHKWEIGQMDIEAAFLQAVGFTRLIYVRPPREANQHGILWRLDLAAYGLTDSGRLWYLTSNDQLVRQHGLTRSRLDYTLYHMEDHNGRLDFVLAVQVDDYLYAGTSARMKAFEDFLHSTFDVGKFARRSLSLMGCEISQSADYSITLSQKHMLDDINPALLTESAGTRSDEPATEKQATIYRHIIGKMLFVGRMSSPSLLLHASMAASKLANLRTHHLRALAATLKRLRTHDAKLLFISPPAQERGQSPPPAFLLDVMSDGATASSGETKSRGGHLIFRRLGKIVHPIQWSARCLRRIARSSSTAETLAAADAMSNGLYLRSILLELCCAHLTELTVDSSSLASLSTSIKEPEEKLNKVDLAAIREAYDDGDLDAVHWCPGQKLLADALTKDNRVTAELLLAALSSGMHERPQDMTTNLGRPPI